MSVRSTAQLWCSSSAVSVLKCPNNVRRRIWPVSSCGEHESSRARARQGRRRPMRNRFSILAALTAVAAAGFVWACDEGPSTPSQTSQSTTQNPPPPAVSSLTLTGPGTVALNETTQFTVTARMSDGTTLDVTNQAVWRSSNSAVLSVSANGVASGRGSGDVWVTASYSNRVAIKNDVIVVPAGTYRVSGSVTDEGTGIPEAHVDVWPASATSTTTDSGG